MSHTEREQQTEFEELVGKFIEGAADWESQGWAGLEVKPRVRGAIPTRGLLARGAVRTRGAATPSARISSLSELVKEVKLQLSKASLIFVLDGDYNKAAAKFCEELAQSVGEKEPAAWWIKPEKQEEQASPQWPWRDVVGLDWQRARDHQIAESLVPDIVFVSASPQGTQRERVARWWFARSVVAEGPAEVALPADTIVGPRIFIFTEGGTLHPYSS